MAGVVAISGRLLEPEILVDEVVSHMPVMFVHGDQDEVVPPQSMPMGWKVTSCRFQRCLCSIQKGTGHGMAPDGLGVSLAFLRDQLGLQT